MIRSLLPRNHGGINAENVIVIDADNSSNPYLYVNIAREHGMHYSNVLHKVLVSRQFTIYQLANTIIYDLPKRIQIHKPKVIVVSGLLDQFYQDPYIKTTEVESLTSQIVTALHKIKDVFIILTSRFTDNQIEFPTNSCSSNGLSNFFNIVLGWMPNSLHIFNRWCPSRTTPNSFTIIGMYRPFFVIDSFRSKYSSSVSACTNEL